jgi:hypothetical protein
MIAVPRPEKRAAFPLARIWIFCRKLHAMPTFHHAFFLTVTSAACFTLAPLQAKDSVPESTLSPDEKLGVTVPDEATLSAVKVRRDGTPEKFLHRLIEVKTGRVLAEIKAANGLEQMNHGGVEPRWTKDGSGLLWVIAGKWFPRAAVYLRVQEDAVAWQTDLLRSAQTEMLRRTKQAVPKAFAAAVSQNKGNGSAYPQGFTIDINLPEQNPTLPLNFTTTLVANPKAIESYPEGAEVFARMSGILNADGSLTWSGFKAWTGSAARRAHGAAEE